MSLISGINVISTFLLSAEGPYESAAHPGEIYITGTFGTEVYHSNTGTTGVTWTRLQVISTPDGTQFVARSFDGQFIVMIYADSTGSSVQLTTYDVDNDVVTSYDISADVPGLSSSVRVACARQADGQICVAWGSDSGALITFDRFNSGSWQGEQIFGDESGGFNAAPASIETDSNNAYVFFYVHYTASVDAGSVIVWCQEIDPGGSKIARALVVQTASDFALPARGSISCIYNGRLFFATNNWGVWASDLNILSFVNTEAPPPNNAGPDDSGRGTQTEVNIVTNGVTLWQVWPNSMDSGDAGGGVGGVSDQIIVSQYIADGSWTAPSVALDFNLIPPVPNLDPDFPESHLHATAIFSDSTFGTVMDFYDDSGICYAYYVNYNEASVGIGLGCISPPDAVVGVPYSHSISAYGGAPPYAFSIVAMVGFGLPPGLSLSSAGLISGTPTSIGFNGHFDFKVQVTDSLGHTAETWCSMLVRLVQVVCLDLPSGDVGVPYDQQLQIVGGSGSYTATITAGSLPPGLTMISADTNPTMTPLDRSGWVATATGDSFGAFPASNAIDGDPNTDWNATTFGAPLPQSIMLDMGSPQSFDAITVLPRQPGGGGQAPPTAMDLYVSSDGVSWGSVVEHKSYSGPGRDLIFWQLSTSYTFQFVKITITAGDLNQADMAEVNLGTITAPGMSAGEIIGTPTTSGTYVFTVHIVASGGTGEETITCSITIIGRVHIECGDPPLGFIGQSYSHALPLSGGFPPYTVTLTAGALPPGLVMDSDGLIHGTPTATGTYGFGATVTDSEDNTDDVACSITIGELAQVPCSITILTGGSQVNCSIVIDGTPINPDEADASCQIVIENNILCPIDSQGGPG